MLNKYWHYFIALLAFGILSIVWGFEYWGGFTPCQLCLWQRNPWWVLIFLGLIGRFLPHKYLYGMMALTMLISAGLGAFHAGVEWHFWQGLSSCSGSSLSNNLDTAMTQLFQKPVISCSEAKFRFLGLSFAGWNFMASLAMAGFFIKNLLKPSI